VSEDNYGLIEMLLFFGMVLGILFWQLYTVRK